MTPLEEHARNKYAEAARDIVSKRKIYLDVRYWIIVREVAAGERVSTGNQQVLQDLRAGVRDGRFVCPMSDATFMEWTKQSATSRRANAELIDELSLGYALAPLDGRVEEEMTDFLISLISGNNSVPLVWTRTAHVFGIGDLNDPRLAMVPLTTQKAAFDHRWNTTLVEMVDAFGDRLPQFDTFNEALAEKITADSAAHSHELGSYRQAYLEEAKGAVEFFSKIIGPRLFAKGLVLYDDDKLTPERSINTLMHFIHAGVTKPKFSQFLPTMRTMVSLHAAMRWDKKRKFKKNDFLDIQHAAGAQSYCDVFLTERPLKALMESQNISLPRPGACTVAAETDEAIAALRA